MFLTWDARVLHKSTAVFRDESQVDRKCRFVVDDAADSMYAICVQLLGFVAGDAVLVEQLRHKNNLEVQGWNFIACLLSAKLSPPSLLSYLSIL
jgi:hypothetical protein